jgi:hypothetical protein
MVTVGGIISVGVVVVLDGVCLTVYLFVCLKVFYLFSFFKYFTFFTLLLSYYYHITIISVYHISISYQYISNMSLPIPDLRFESTFRRQLAARARATAVASAAHNDKDSDSDSDSDSDDNINITWTTVASVVLKDIVLMPLVQGILYTGALMMLRPWLRAVTRFGYNTATLLIAQFKAAVRYGPASAIA